MKDATEREKGPDAVTAKICRQIEALDYSICGGIENVEGIGIGVPGPVDVVKGVMIMASNLPGFENYPIAEKLSTKFNKPVFLDNDANVAGLAEAVLGAGKDYPTCYYVTVSTGIGGAFTVNKQLISGGRGHAGEIGNIIVKNNGYKQGALNPGAAEGECSGTAITRKGQEALGKDLVHHAGDVFRLAAEGNETAQGIADEEISVGSDRRLKQAIEYRMDKYENFFMKLKPAQYQLKAGKSKRLHTGFIAQDVERALLESGLTTNDFAGLTITPVQEVNPKDGIDDVFYRLRYGEFISLNTYMIQTLYRRISELEEKIKSL